MYVLHVRLNAWDLVLAHDALETPFTLAFCDIRSLVVELLSSRQSNLHLYIPVLEVELQRHDRIAFLLCRITPFLDLPTMHEQLAGPDRVVIHLIAVRVRRDVAIEHDHLSVLNGTVSILQVRLSVSQGLHLSARQNHASLERIVDVVVVPSLTVRRDDLYAFGHCTCPAITTMNRNLPLRQTP